MSHRYACDCCEHGSCVDNPEDCPDSTAFSFTQPAFDVNLAATSISQTAFVSENYTAGAVSCTGESSCLLDFRCHTCGSFGTCPSCEEYNYDVTTIPCILRRCDGTDCDDNHEWEWGHGTFSGQTVGAGSAVVSVSCGTRTYTPCMNTMMWVPQVTSIDTNPSGSGGAYWEYSIIWWCNLPQYYIGCSTDGVANCACGVYKDNCGRIGGAAWQQIMDYGASPFFWRTGVFTVRKENDSCFRAEWNGATQTGSGINVISITPPSSGGNIGIQTGSKMSAVSGTCTSDWDNDCSTCAYSSVGGFNKYFQIDTGDTFATSIGGTASWTLT